MSRGREEIKWHLQIIFIYYTSYADRNNFSLLKQQNYRRFLIDSDTIKHESSLVHYDLAFQKISHSAIIFKDFLALIPNIAQLKYKKMNRAQAFNQYILKHIQPLFEEIMSKSEFGQDVDKIVSTQITPKLHSSLSSIPVNEKIYNEYIGSTSHAKNALQVFENLHSFMKDFQICPQLLPKSIAFVEFLSIIKNADHDAFSYHDFISALIITSNATERRLSSADLCPIGKMTKLLERMEISPGFEKISKRITCESSTTPSILQSFLESSKETDHCLERSQLQYSRIFPASTRHQKCNGAFDFSSEKVKLQRQNYESVKGAIQQESVSFSKDSREIKLAFEELCSYGEVANTKTLKSFKIKKLFERVGIIEVVGKPWLDIQIVNLQRSSKTGKMQFPQFLELLSVTAKKTNTPFSEICHIVLSDKQNVDQQDQSYFSAHSIGDFSPEDQQVLKGVLTTAEKQLQKIYLHYTAGKRLMTFEELTKCMYDLEVFPGILSKNKLFHIFSTLSEVREETQSQSESVGRGSRVKTLQNYLKDEKMIEFSGFLLGIIEFAQQICDNSLSSPQKLIVLLQKINDTPGYKGLNHASLVKELRRKFGGYYVESFKRAEKEEEGFDELLEGLIF